MAALLAAQQGGLTGSGAFQGPTPGQLQQLQALKSQMMGQQGQPRQAEIDMMNRMGQAPMPPGGGMLGRGPPPMYFKAPASPGNPGIGPGGPPMQGGAVPLPQPRPPGAGIGQPPLGNFQGMAPPTGMMDNPGMGPPPMTRPGPGSNIFKGMPDPSAIGPPTGLAPGMGAPPMGPWPEGKNYDPGFTVRTPPSPYGNPVPMPQVRPPTEDPNSLFYGLRPM
jgi:hypothetical protein